MEKWHWTALILCAFGFFKEFRPSEPFFTPFIIEFKNISESDLTHKFYPASTYSNLGTLAVVFIVTDFLRYRSVVIVEGFAYFACWILLCFGPECPANGCHVSFYAVEILYGLACSTEVAYFTYIYAKVNKSDYKKVTTYTYSAIFAGRCFAGLVSQILHDHLGVDYLELHYVSLGSVTIAFAVSWLLPKVDQSIYFYRGDAAKLSFRDRVKTAYPILWKDCKAAYTNSYVLKGSIWWAIATAGHYQTVNYVQLQWEWIIDPDTKLYNGYIEATHTFLSTVLAFGVGYLKLDWKRWGDGFLGIASIAQAIVLVILSQTQSLTVAYITYIIFRLIFQVMITVVSAEITQGISDDSYGLVFGVNTFLALVLQTLLTLIVVDENGLAFEPPDQFLTYGISFGVLGCACLFFAGLALGGGSNTVATTYTVTHDEGLEKGFNVKNNSGINEAELAARYVKTQDLET